MAAPLQPVTVDPGAGPTIQGPAGGPLTFEVRETFFDRFAELPDGPVDPGAFARLGRDLGMDVLGPPPAVSDPL